MPLEPEHPAARARCARGGALPCYLSPVVPIELVHHGRRLRWGGCNACTCVASSHVPGRHRVLVGYRCFLHCVARRAGCSRWHALTIRSRRTASPPLNSSVSLQGQFHGSEALISGLPSDRCI